LFLQFCFVSFNLALGVISVCTRYWKCVKISNNHEFG